MRITDLCDKYGVWALVAGAAEGLGEAWSRSLAKRGINLIMVDRNREAMEQLSQDLAKQYNTKTRALELDLVEEDAADRMMDQIKETNCRFVVYNAAYSIVQRFRDNKEEDLSGYVGVNVRSPLRLVHAFTKFHGDDTHQRKAIILMSSLAGLWGTKYLGVYGATKAFNRILAESIHTELKPLGFDVMTCIAGATSTPAYLGSNPQYGSIRPSIMQPDAVTEGALKALGKRALFVPGFNNKLTYALLSRLLPRSSTVALFNKTVGDMYRNV